jgi:hypothetical protein
MDYDKALVDILWENPNDTIIDAKCKVYKQAYEYCIKTCRDILTENQQEFPSGVDSEQQVERVLNYYKEAIKSFLNTAAISLERSAEHGIFKAQKIKVDKELEYLDWNLSRSPIVNWLSMDVLTDLNIFAIEFTNFIYEGICATLLAKSISLREKQDCLLQLFETVQL